MNVRPNPVEADDVQRELEELVARIRARGVGEELPRPSEEARQHFIEHLRDERVMTGEELAAWTAEWEAVEKEMRDRDHADDVAEGRAW
jgi:hypothetical protein